MHFGISDLKFRVKLS